MSDLINFELLGAQMRMSREDEEIIRADERRKVIKDLYASDKSSTLKELLNLARTDERKKTIDEFAEKIREYSESYFIDCDPYWGTVETAFKTDIFLDDIVEEMKGDTE